MSASGLSDLIDDVKQVIGGFQPDNRDQIEDFFRELPEFIRGVSEAIGQAASNMDGEHIHQAVIDATCELAQAVGGATDSADEVFQEHITQHKVWRD